MGVNEELMKLYEEMQKCQRCNLAKLPINKTKPYGKPGRVKILIIGQNPSCNRPIGKQTVALSDPDSGYISDKLLDAGLREIGLTLADVYTTNIVKCSTENNKPPSSRTVKICASTFLAKEIKIIRPKIIVTLGRIASGYFGLEPGQSVNRFGTYIFALYHPIYYSRGGRAAEFVNTFKKIGKVIPWF